MPRDMSVARASHDVRCPLWMMNMVDVGFTQAGRSDIIGRRRHLGHSDRQTLSHNCQRHPKHCNHRTYGHWARKVIYDRVGDTHMSTPRQKTINHHISYQAILCTHCACVHSEAVHSDFSDLPFNPLHHSTVELKEVII